MYDCGTSLWGLATWPPCVSCYNERALWNLLIFGFVGQVYMLLNDLSLSMPVSPKTITSTTPNLFGYLHVLCNVVSQLISSQDSTINICLSPRFHKERDIKPSQLWRISLPYPSSWFMSQNVRNLPSSINDNHNHKLYIHYKHTSPRQCI